MGQITEIDAATAKEWFDAGEAHLVDVREDPELAEAAIDGADHVAMSTLTPENIAERVKAPEGKKLVIFCAHGQRSYNIAGFLAQNDLVDEAFTMAGGIVSWADAGYPVK